jgi:hypothetical protein
MNFKGLSFDVIKAQLRCTEQMLVLVLSDSYR